MLLETEFPFNPMSKSNSKNILFQIEIADDRTIAAVQSEFHAQFQYLKIEFFKAPHKIGEASAKNLIYGSSRYIRECRINRNASLLDISESMTVNELEGAFSTQFGLSVQVFRKSGNVWLETSATDGWSLKQQNDEGAELSSQIK
ncbi:hypothetical protein BH11BAC2_BH11BAC2_19300 [soil metagenome]